ncbi:DUF4132 domain-containing protein [Catenuloplanes japonicus]|uniref:DUF4132 domain-containing protein n=1 Tax=Catenuloplanes japonicus TaxID=33876 RepID=UPI000691CB0F|nr:DUF4132 domain-containing protein [Catenuloplanes japonicus]
MRFEDGWEMPQEWREAMFPRRGGRRVPPPEIEPGAAERLAALLDAAELGTAADAEYDHELRAEGRRFAADLHRPAADLSARGAAAAALLLDYKHAEPAAQAWIERAGPVFAARAVAELAGMLFHPARREQALYRRSLSRAAQGGWDWQNPECQRHGEDQSVLVHTAATVRAHLASAADADYAAAVDVLGGYRGGPLPQRIIATFLVPGRPGWADADIAALPGWFADYAKPPGRFHGLLAFCLESADQAHRLSAMLTSGALKDLRLGIGAGWRRPHAFVATILDALGPAGVPLLTGDPLFREAAGFQHSFQREIQTEGLEVLLSIPTDEALHAVIWDTVDTRQLDFHRLGVLTRDPARALRVLAADRDTALAHDVLGLQVLTKPALLDLLGDDDRARVMAVVGDGSTVGTRFADMLDRYDLHRERQSPWRRYQVFHGAPERKKVISWLASIPTDEAFALLAARADRKYVRQAVTQVAAREPARALRVLAGLTPDRPEAAEVVAELLHHHVLAHPDTVIALLPDLDPQARARVEASLTTAPAATGPIVPDDALPAALRTVTKAKALPGWLSVATLPPIRVPGHDGALPEPAVRQLLALLTRSTFAVPHPGLAEVRETCDRASLAAFGWALFTQWQTADHPAADKQALHALAFLGDNSTVPQVSALIPEWAFGAAARVKSGLEVLGAIGTDVALTHLQRVARKARQKGFRALAEAKLAQIAQARGLTPAELADRIVPDLGLAADGRLTLDFGPRQFTVTFDEKLHPTVSDADGRPLKGLPRVVAADDATLAAEAKRTFAALKKDARQLASERGRALEEAMLTGRTWSVPDFRALVLGHPVVRHLARALLWRVDGGPGFRVAEDGSLADADEKTLTLADDQRVGLYHPATAGPERAAWAEIFADYETFQPFPQVAREVHRLSEAQAATATLADFTGGQTDDRALFVLAARGWQLAGGLIERAWPGGYITQIAFWPDYNPLYSDSSELRTLSTVTVSGPPDAVFGDLDPIAASEVLREAHRLVART